MNYYEILDVSKLATEKEIKKAYRKLAKKYHPDEQTGDQVKFNQVKEAYEILTDPEKRKNYDQTGGNTTQKPTTAPQPPQDAESKLKEIFNKSKQAQSKNDNNPANFTKDKHNVDNDAINKILRG